MTVVTTRIVAADGGVSTADPLPPGEHEAAVTLAPQPTARRFTVKDLPMRDLSWDDSVSLRREHLYDEEGRLR